MIESVTGLSRCCRLTPAISHEKRWLSMKPITLFSFEDDGKIIISPGLPQ